VPGKIGAGNRLTFADDIERNTSIDIARRRASGNTKICGIYFPHSQEAYCSAREQYAWIKYLSSVFLFARTFFAALYNWSELLSGSIGAVQNDLVSFEAREEL
jgi:hypothetical protein